MLFDQGRCFELGLTNFYLQLLNLVLVCLLLEQPLLEFPVKFVPVVLQQLLKVQNFLVLEFQLVLVEQLNRGDVCVPEMCQLDLEQVCLFVVTLCHLCNPVPKIPIFLLDPPNLLPSLVPQPLNLPIQVLNLL